MNLKNIVSILLFLFIVEKVSCSNSLISSPLKPTTLSKENKKTKRKPISKNIVYLMIAGLIIPLGAGYYVIKKK